MWSIGMGSQLSCRSTLLVSVVSLLIASCVPASHNAMFVESKKNQYSSRIGDVLEVKLENETDLERYMKRYPLLLWLDVRQLVPEHKVRIASENIVVLFNDRRMEISALDTSWTDDKYSAYFEFRIQTIEADFDRDARLQFLFDSVFYVNDSILQFGPVSALDELYKR